MKWLTVYKTKLKGGLGVRSLYLLNKALLCKWSWCYSCKRDMLWKKVISGKYGEDEVWCCEVRDTNGAGLWKTIRKE